MGEIDSRCKGSALAPGIDQGKLSEDSMPEDYGLAVFWTEMWKRDCVYQWIPGIGWHIVGFL
jgi:hypothetical protein